MPAAQLKHPVRKPNDSRQPAKGASRGLVNSSTTIRRIKPVKFERELVFPDRHFPLSLGLLLSGWLIAGTGIVSGAETQAPEAVHRIAALTFVIGPVLMVAAFFILRKYPVTRESLRAMEQKSGAQK